MTSRFLTRLLLSLLLLVTQQMAMSHAIAHWSGPEGSSTSAAQGANGEEGSWSKANAEELQCAQCVVSAQFASFLGNTPRWFAPDQARSCPHPAAAPHAMCRRTEWVFQPRGPPAGI